MTHLQQAYARIPVPADLEGTVLSACLAEKPVSSARYWVPITSVAAAAAVLLTTLSVSGRLDGVMTQMENWLVGPDENRVVTDDETTTAVNNTTTMQQTIAISATATQTVVSRDEDAVLSGDVQNSMYALPADYKTMTLEQLQGYFGRRIRPARVPEDLKQQTLSIGYSVWYRNEEKMKKLTDWEKKQFENGTWRDDEVIYDHNVILYVGENNRSLSVAVSTAPFPRNQLGDMSRFDEDVTVAGVTAKLAYYDDRIYGGESGYSYTVLFIVDGIEFCVNGWNLPRREFLDVVESIIQ